MNKLGMHIHGLTSEAYTALELLQPRVVTIMDPTAQWVRDIRDASPGTFIVARKYEHGQDWQSVDPFQWAEQNYEMTGGEPVDGFIAWNEPFGHDSTNLFSPFDEWAYSFLYRCRDLGSAEAVCLCFGTGNFTDADDRVRVNEAFPLTCYNAKYLGPHDYSWPTLSTAEGWHALRWRAWLDDVGRDDLKVIVTEAGLTQSVIEGRDNVGWRSGGPEGVTEDSYVATLDWYNERLCEIPQCLGCTLFDYAGAQYNWPTFEQLGLETRIFLIDAPELELEPEPNGGGEMDVKVFDFDGGEQDWAWLVQTFGDNLKILPVEEKFALETGDRIYKVDVIRAKRGYAACCIQVKDQGGNPVAGETVVWGWPDAPALELEDKGWNWTIIGDDAPTNETGDVCPGMGTGAYYHPDDPDDDTGPHWCWVYDLPSDYVEGIGMLSLTFHDHPDIGYREVIYQEEEEPGNGDGEPGKALELISEIETKLGQLREVLEEYDARVDALADLI